MSNIAISQIDTTAQSINVGDLLLVSKNNGDGTYTSAKIDASKLLLSCRELDYSDSKASIPRYTDIFKKDDSTDYITTYSDNAKLNTSKLIEDFGIGENPTTVTNLYFDYWTIPYSGILKCSYLVTSLIPYAVSSGTSVWERCNCGITVNNYSLMHWHTEVIEGAPGAFPAYPDGIRRYNDMDCQEQWCIVNAGDQVRFSIAIMSLNSTIDYIKSTILIPFKYQ